MTGNEDNEDNEDNHHHNQPMSLLTRALAASASSPAGVGAGVHATSGGGGSGPNSQLSNFVLPEGATLVSDLPEGFSNPFQSQSITPQILGAVQNSAATAETGAPGGAQGVYMSPCDCVSVCLCTF